MSGVCVIGLGSPHGDDQIGWELVRFLAADAAADAALRLHTCATVGGELLEFWKDAELAILVDAVRGAGLPGTVHRQCLHPRAGRPIPDAARMVSSHGLGIPELIELAEALDALPQRLLLFGVEAGACAPFAALSAPVHAALPELVLALHKEIGERIR